MYLIFQVYSPTTVRVLFAGHCKWWEHWNAFFLLYSVLGTVIMENGAPDVYGHRTRRLYWMIASSSDRGSGDQRVKCSFHLISLGARPIAEGLGESCPLPSAHPLWQQRSPHQMELTLKTWIKSKIMGNKPYWWMVNTSFYFFLILHFKSRGKIQIFHL